jgi:hypothetical protein
MVNHEASTDMNLHNSHITSSSIEQEPAQESNKAMGNKKMVKPASVMDATAALKTLRPFIGPGQMNAIANGMRGEEKQFFLDKAVELASIVASMPSTFQQRDKGLNAVVHVHYFVGQSDFYLTEKDCIEDEPQHQAFGQANIGYGPELGYISLPEILRAGAELDFHFKPTTLAVIRQLPQRANAGVPLPTAATVRQSRKV